jgi:hypothetical protein
MEAFSPVGASLHQADHVSSAVSSPDHHQNTTPTTTTATASKMRQSSLRHSTTAVDDADSLTSSASKRSFPLMERLQSAIKNIEERSASVEPVLVSGQKPADHAIMLPIPASAKPDTTLIDTVSYQNTLPVSTLPEQNQHLLKQFEQIVERHTSRLHSLLQSDLHALHMDMLKQGIALQRHQEAMLEAYVPQVKEVMEELRVLREENGRLRARLGLF